MPGEGNTVKLTPKESHKRKGPISAMSSSGSTSSSSSGSSSESEYSDSPDEKVDVKTGPAASNSKTRSATGTSAQQRARHNTTSSEENGVNSTTNKKPARPNNNLTSFQKRKNSAAKNTQSETAKTVTNGKDTTKKESNGTLNKEIPITNTNGVDRKALPKSGTMPSKARVKKHPQTKNLTLSRRKNSTNKKSSEGSQSRSGSANSANESTSSNESDATGTTNTTTPRKLRMRRPKALRHNGTESDSELEAEKRSLTKSPAKKSATAAKSKGKKENTTNVKLAKPRLMSPLQQFENKCQVEGCDSSGHLSGNLETHYLPEACPIFHNMSASECKERASDRRLRAEQRQKTKGTVTPVSATATSASVARVLTNEQKEFVARMRESRAQFKPANTLIKADKIKLEKDCTDDDREPASIAAGLVPDYDLQLFREAQAIASEHIEEELSDLPFGKGIKYITMGKYKMKVWYQSPYPEDAARLPKIYICEFCLRYQKSEISIKRHALKCIMRHPPGDEIYRKGKLQVWQVDGKRQKQYCQHLCLLAKFFLDHKTLYYDVEPFLFYIMTLADVDGCHTVGYFSKEKNSFYNVSCILTLPPYQRKGYGRLLIDFSYLLTRVEGKIGSPEKPLSDLGLISYRSYWKDILLDHLCGRSGNTLSIKEVSQEMAIYSYDIVSTLQALGMMKYWKGKHIVLKKQDVLDEYEERVKHRGNFPKIDDSCLRWSPFVPPQNSNAV